MKSLKWFIMLVLFLGLVFIREVEVKAQEVDFSDVGNIIDEMVEQKVRERHVPNGVVTVVHKGDVVFTKGYGLVDFKSGEGVASDTSLFRVGSISKLFTWTAIMQLVEENKLDLDADVNDYLDFEIPDGRIDSGPITLRHLLTHTPGFEDYPDAIFRLEADVMLPLNEYIQEYLPERVFPAGEVIAYSNYGATLAGYIVEQVSGLKFSKYIKKNIFEPLHMEDSTFRQPLPANLSQNMTQPYRYVNGELLLGDFEYFPVPAGGMSSTATDMAKFMLAMLGNDSRLLEPATMKEMHQQQFIAHPSLDGMTLGFMERTMQGKRVIAHAGSTMLYDSGLYLVPEADLGVFISYSGENYTLHTQVFHELMEHYFPVPQLDSPEPILEMKERAKQYSGEYHQNRRSFTTSEKFVSLINGTIRVEIDESGYLLVTHMGSVNRFIEIEEGVYQNLNETEQLDPYGEFATIVFDTNASGKVTLMTDGPMSYSKAPWYSTSEFTFLSLISSIIIIIGSTIFWIIAGAIKRMKRRKKQQPKLVSWAKGLTVLYGIFTIVFLVGFLLDGEIDPIYGLPIASYTESPGWMAIFDIVPYILSFLSMILVPFFGVIWWKKTGSVLGRIHYTFFVMMTVILSWIFYYWNIL